MGGSSSSDLTVGFGCSVEPRSLPHFFAGDASPDKQDTVLGDRTGAYRGNMESSGSSSGSDKASDVPALTLVEGLCMMLVESGRLKSESRNGSS
ncbi:hypothetical protein DL766_006538 [Monosporascus sp. MC13-8B]|uniref:Uncharacterized protein n=1 Tax=Monosporascus cannonballus TaxID=155416 RepID=A0ABY0GUJ3_9PEZI|nr:hypothetical protein DL763_011013 [Monosporascus cannonballus]RYO77632.1 hypothetical protein DL762_009135 [Monosporascus cannonballus]RYP27000.1 hypothetical protein DL766_006538 [Monosporascus sp. MC13-8B]